MRPFPPAPSKSKLLVALAGSLACLTTFPCLAQDVTRPGDLVVPSSGNYPGAESPDKTIDNLGNTKYLNFDRLFTGFTVTPSGTGVVRSLTIVTANDAPERDPTSYILEGSDDGSTFTTIASGNFNPSTARFAIDQQSFANATQYAQYRITFPTIRTPSSANSMQVAEVQFNTNINIFTPGDAFVTTYSTGGSSSAGETAANLFDNRLGTKFGIGGGNLGPTTVEVTPGAGASTAEGFEIYGGNDDQNFPGRTPAYVTLYGSNDGTTFTQIFTTPLTQVSFNYEGQQFSFANTTSYTRYRIEFGPCSANFAQIGEFRLMGSVSNAAPGNDTCATAQTVAAGSISSSNLNATGATTSSCGTNDMLDVWYSYHASNSGPIEINTIGAGELDTTLQVFDGCGGPAVACNDNANNGKSRVTFSAIANHNYKIRVAGANMTTGAFALNIITSPVSHTDVAVALNYNFNGIVQSGEEGNPDSPLGYRAISDRGLALTGTVGSLEVGLEGRTGIPYTVITTPDTLDMVQLGDRNQVDGGGRFFDDIIDGDNIGVQPDWLTNTDQTGPQTTTLSTPQTMGVGTQIGVLYDASNGGNNFDLILNFAAGDPVSVRLNAPDWYGEQHPTGPGAGVAEQEMLAAYHGTQNTDLAEVGVDLNVIEAVVTTASLLDAGFDVNNRQLISITFANADSANAGIGIYAATIRDAGPACAADFNGDTVVDFFDYLDFVQAFSVGC